MSGYGFDKTDADAWTRYFGEAFELIKTADQDYNYPSRFAVTDSYAIFAAGEYGILIYALP